MAKVFAILFLLYYRVRIFQFSLSNNSLMRYQAYKLPPDKKSGKNTQKNCTKKDLHDPDNRDGVITHLEPDILECEVKWALGSITTNKASGIPL